MNNVKTIFYKTLNTIVGTNRVDNQEAYIINDYIGRLEATIKDEQQRIQKAIEYIESRAKKAQVKLMPREIELLDILRGENNEQ